MPKTCRPALRGADERNALVTSNLGLAHSEVQKFFLRHPDARKKYPYEDAVADATLGLLRGAELFDPDLGYAFSTYATRWIKLGIQRGFRRTRFVHIPFLGPRARATGDRFATFRARGYTQFANELERELAGRFNDHDDAHWDPEDAKTDVPDDAQRDELRTAMRSVLAHFDKREQEILYYRFWEGCSCSETGRLVGLSRQRVDQVEDRLLKRFAKLLVDLDVNVDNFV